MIGHDLERDDIRTFRVSRIRSDIRFATRRERDFRLPPEFDVENYRGRADWQFGDIVGEAKIEVAPDTAWWVERAYGGERNHIEGDVFTTQYASSTCSPAGSSARTAAPSRSSRPSCVGSTVEGARAARSAHEGAAPRLRPAFAAEGVAASVAERFAGPGRARALRRPAVAARLPARPPAATSARA